MEILELLRKHTREELGKILEFTEDNFERTVTAFLHEKPARTAPGNGFREVRETTD